MHQISLGEALRNGDQLKHNDGHTQVVAALKGMGALPPDLDSDNRYFVPDQGNQYQTAGYSEDALVKRRPWLNEKLLCPWCAIVISGPEIVSHPINHHSGEIELGEECDWLEEMEAEPEHRAALAVYFPSACERRRVMRAAQAFRVTPSELIGAAIRLVLDYRFPLQPVRAIQ
jgi:hypothetical protein